MLDRSGDDMEQGELHSFTRRPWRNRFCVRYTFTDRFGLTHGKVQRERTTGIGCGQASAMGGWRNRAQIYFLCYIKSSGSGHENGTFKLLHKCESVEGSPRQKEKQDSLLCLPICIIRRKCIANAIEECQAMLSRASRTSHFTVILSRHFSGMNTILHAGFDSPDFVEQNGSGHLEISLVLGSDRLCIRHSVVGIEPP